MTGYGERISATSKHISLSRGMSSSSSNGFAPWSATLLRAMTEVVSLDRRTDTRLEQAMRVEHLDPTFTPDRRSEAWGALIASAFWLRLTFIGASVFVIAITALFTGDMGRA